MRNEIGWKSVLISTILIERYIVESKSYKLLENLCLLVFNDNKSTETPFDAKELARERIAIDSPSFDGKGTFLVN